MPDPLVLLPGMNCSARLWDGVGLDGPVLTPELPSTGGLESCVTELLGSLPERFALAGLSLGGIVAMAMLRRAPERVTALCLLSTNPHAPTPQQLCAWRAQRDELAAGRSARDLQSDLLPVLLADRSAAADAVVLAMADDVGDSALAAQLALQATRIDERPWLPRVGVPTLVLAAERDALCPVAKHEELAALIPAAKLHVLSGAGHLSPLEAASQVTGRMRDWLAAIRPATR